MKPAAPRVLLLAAFFLSIFASPARGEVKLTVPEKDEILFEAISNVFSRMKPEEVRKFRGLPIGSWWKGTWTDASDIDFTLGHESVQMERKTVEEISAEVDRLAEKRIRAKPDFSAADEALLKDPKTLRALHKIHVLPDRGVLDDEKFRGEIGQTFLKEYVDAPVSKTITFPDGRKQVVRYEGGRACIVFDAETGPGGKTVISHGIEDTKRFWLDRRRKVPGAVERVATFVEDNMVFLSGVRKTDTASLLERALSAPKYMNNIEPYRTTIQKRYGDPLEALDVPAELKKKLSVLKEAKGMTTEAAQREFLLKNLGVPEGELDKTLTQILDDCQGHLVKARDRIEVLEKFHGRKSLQGAGSVDDLLKQKAAVENSMLRALGKGAATGAFAAVDVYFILDAYYTKGPEAAMLEAGRSAAFCALPQAALVAMLADLGKELALATGKAVVNRLLFDPLNARELQEMYKEGSQFNPFTLEGSPFLGLSRETLSYVFKSEAKVRQAVERYLYVAKSAGSKDYTTEGAGSIEPLLAAQMAKDWRDSDDLGDSIRVRGAHLNGVGEIYPVDEPLKVRVGETAVLPGSSMRRRFGMQTDASGRATFKVLLCRQFGVRQRLPVKPGEPTLYDAWGKGGTPAVCQMMAKKMIVDLETGRVPLRMSATLENAQGWDLQGWPVRWTRSGGGGEGAGEFEIANEHQLSARYETLRLAFKAGPEAKGPATARVRIEFKTDEIDAKPREFLFTLVATPGKAPPEAEPEPLPDPEPVAAKPDEKEPPKARPPEPPPGDPKPAPDEPKPPEPLTPSARTQKTSVSIGEAYVAPVNADISKPHRVAVGGPGTLSVACVYHTAAQSWKAYGAGRFPASVRWQGEGVVRSGYLKMPEVAGLSGGKRFYKESVSSSTSIRVEKAGIVVFSLAPESAQAYQNGGKWVDDWYGATHLHNLGGRFDLEFTFTPSTR